MEKLPRFHFWCQKVLPLVYDNSLSYYEVLCKVVDYINKIIGDSNSLISEVNELKEELAIVQKWIEDFDTTYLEELIADQLAHMIWIGINNAGYIVYYIPRGWEEIVFNTTGLDIDVDNVDYGHLVLSFEVGGN